MAITQSEAKSRTAARDDDIELAGCKSRQHCVTIESKRTRSSPAVWTWIFVWKLKRLESGSSNHHLFHIACLSAPHVANVHISMSQYNIKVIPPPITWPYELSRVNITHSAIQFLYTIHFAFICGMYDVIIQHVVIVYVPIIVDVFSIIT